MRIQVTDNAETSTYIHSGLNTIYEENSAGCACYIYGPTGLLAKRTTTDQESGIYYYTTDRLGSTRLVTDENKNIVSAVTYYPFGKPDIEEGSENYLFTGKERDSTGLYYYGARYYDPEVGRFLTRDQKRGKVSVPGTLNRYAYCANNPIKFLDSDGRDYFDPAWGQGRDGTWGSELKFALVRVGLWTFKGQGELLTSYWNWASQNPHLSSLFGAGLTGVAAFCLKACSVGGYYGVVAGLIVGVALVGLNWMAENASYLWNDPEYVELYETIEMYAEQLMKGHDCEQEYLDAWCMLAVYLLMKQYGDNWREHADPELLDYYDEMMERKKDNSKKDGKDGSNSNGSSGSGNGSIPPIGPVVRGDSIV